MSAKFSSGRFIDHVMQVPGSTATESPCCVHSASGNRDAEGNEWGEEGEEDKWSPDLCCF